MNKCRECGAIFEEPKCSLTSLEPDQCPKCLSDNYGQYNEDEEYYYPEYDYPMGVSDEV